MTTTDVTLLPAAPLALTDRQEGVRATARGARAAHTIQLYRIAWEGFARWCEAEKRDPLEGPGLVAEFLRDLVDGKVEGRHAGSVSQVGVTVAAIAAGYEDAGRLSPARDPGMKLFLKGLRRELGAASRKAGAVTDVELRVMLEGLGTGLAGIRDRALLLVGWAGCFRRSELVGLDVGDAHEVRQGLEVTVRRSKTDQAGAGQLKVIPRSAIEDLCPVRALRAWITASGIESGPLFRGLGLGGTRAVGGRLDRGTVSRIVKRAAKRAGLDPTVFSGHSLRSGFLTTAARLGVAEEAMAAQSGHKSVAVLRGYVQRATAWERNAAQDVVAKLGRA